MDISGRRVPLDVRGVFHGPRGNEARHSRPALLIQFADPQSPRSTRLTFEVEGGSAIESRVLVPSPTCQPRASHGRYNARLTGAVPGPATDSTRPASDDSTRWMVGIPKGAQATLSAPLGNATTDSDRRPLLGDRALTSCRGCTLTIRGQQDPRRRQTVTPPGRTRARSVAPRGSARRSPGT